MSVLVSVVVPVYNIEKYLEKCIRSICSQSLKELEIILVDDGSTDTSGSICDQYALEDERIKVIHKPNGGLVSARKAGVVAATGKYIGYVDGDDWVEPQMFERLCHIMTEQDVDVVVCGRYEDTGNTQKEVRQGFPEGRYSKKDLHEKVYPGMIVGKDFFEWGVSPCIWDKLYRREILESYQFDVDERITMGEDAACVYPYLLNADSVYILDECLYHYRQTTTSMIKKVDDYGKEKERFHILYQSVLKRFEEDKAIFDLREQWLKFILFLLVPRADGLYKGFEEKEYLFPFPKVKRGSRIVLYGAGTYGQRLYQFLKRTSFCEVVGWVDRNYAELRKMNLQVDEPGSIQDLEFDDIVIANTFAKSRKGLLRELQIKYPEYNIHLIDESVIFSQETRSAFELLETAKR